MSSRILIVDSHNAQITASTVNLHARNARILAEHYGADLAACEADLLPLAGREYDVVIFNHASAYFDTTAFVNFLKPMTKARFFYITNEYNLGEPWPVPTKDPPPEVPPRVTLREWMERRKVVMAGKDWCAGHYGSDGSMAGGDS